jgi:REP-associated tyrosine transposase
MSRLRRPWVTGKIFFVTCNLLRTRTNMTERDFQALADAVRRVRERRRFLLPAYVFMPDHWHMLIVPAPSDSLPNIMNALKAAAARGVNEMRNSSGPVWQARYFDRAVRDVKEFHEAVRYMHLNPVGKALAEKPEHWPWSSFHSFGGPGPVMLEVDRLDLPTDQTARL